ncbi:hypothetical protein DOTSEDRAFT_74551 [Dothistroma septosporum NZE10]|uniref:DNA polymerase delta subunit 3 n=1 Tax=Dothistroma septosporum (strain NZE10 / CBS 128990) TaxID=675120 RepID=N1PEJ0_DOTSN|nr:hypothetical protein DOTSEDRAFT_74551 [Dothistroma septosporum NZE10]
MAQDYSTWLATNVLNEQQNVSYRNLSRALRVHSNLAKQMLYEFHRKQNSKKPGCVHATYVITGTKRPTQTNGVHSQDDGGDSIMRSSPPLPGSSMPQSQDEAPVPTSTRSIMLVKAEHLDQAKELFEHISGIHIYSLQAGGLSDVQVLTECNRKVQTGYASEDPLKEWKQYGTIQNPSVRRRTRKNGPPPAAASVAKPEVVKAKAAATAAAKTSAAEVKAAVKPPLKSETLNDAKGAHSKPVGSMKSQASTIFKSFAKGAAKPKKTNSQGSSAAASPAALPSPAAPAEDGTEDVPMTDFSDDDVDDIGTNLLGEEPDEVKEPTGPTRKERKAALEALMDEEDEPMKDAEAPVAAEEEEAELDEGAIDKPEAEEEPKENVTVENGRRRGRRRVMKKKTVKDEEGYLVTREEAAWESFSEDEPAPKKAKMSASAPSKTMAKKGGAGKPAGNIMSFFKKK